MIFLADVGWLALSHAELIAWSTIIGAGAIALIFIVIPEMFTAWRRARRVPRSRPAPGPPASPGPVLGFDDHVGQALDITQPTLTRWKHQDCGCSIHLDPPAVIPCPKHAVDEKEILDLLKWRQEMKAR